MTPTERQKKIATAVAVAANAPMLPAAIREGIAAMAEELRELRRAVCGNGCECTGLGSCPLK